MGKNTRCYRYDFRGDLDIGSSNAGLPFTSAVDGSGSVAGATGGGVVLACDATNEAQNVCLYMGDILPFDIDDIIRCSIVAKVNSDSLNAATSLAFGLASARNDAIDSIAEAALFRAIANNTLVLETDDGTNNNDDQSSGGEVIDDAFQRFDIDFAVDGITKTAPALSTGRKSNLHFFITNSRGSRRRVGAGISFDMSNYSGGLQLFAQIQKTSSTAADSLTILEAEVEVNIPV